MKKEFNVSDQNLERLSVYLDVDLKELDQVTLKSLLGMYDPSKSLPTAKACDYLGYISLLVALIALIRLHWFTIIISILLGIGFLFAGFIIQRNYARKLVRNFKENNLFENAKMVAIENGKASPALLQRVLKIPYERAANLMRQLEKEGIIGPADGAKPRDVLSNK